MRFYRILLLALALLAVGGGSARAQSLYGPGGLFLLPTASLPEKGQLTPAFLVLPQHSPLDGKTRTWISGSLDYGASRDLEIGATVLEITSKGAPSEGGFVKYRFLRETTARPAVAAGFTCLGFGQADSRAAFVALRKELAGGKGRRHPVVAHLGLQYASVLDGVQRDALQPYGGMEIGLAPRLAFVGEARRPGRGDFATPFALTLVYRYSAAGRLAVSWANNGRSDSPRLGVGAGISIRSR